MKIRAGDYREDLTGNKSVFQVTYVSHAVGECSLKYLGGVELINIHLQVVEKNSKPLSAARAARLKKEGKI